VNRLDVWIRNGTYPVPYPHILGADVAGEVESLGPDTTGRFPVGTRVLVYPGLSCGECPACRMGRESFCEKLGLLGRQRWGGYAELLAVPEELCLPLPKELSFDEAAALPVAYTTAEHMLSRAGVRGGEAILVFGATGGVGTALIDRARRRGTRTFAVTSQSSTVSPLRRLGAESVLRFPDLTPWDGGPPLPPLVDAALDSVGRSAFPLALSRLRKGGRYAICGASSGAEAGVDLRLVYSRQLEVIGCFLGDRSDLRTLLEEARHGELHPVLHARYALAEAARAHRELDAPHLGKFLLHP
jgi:NADPH:quinone reductase-like Zn-dependent oxidoreductase